MFLTVVLIAGALGTLTRYQLGQLQEPGALPWLTLLINIVGSALMGASYLFFQKFAQASGAQWILAFQIGFLGAFTTYSAYSLDVVKLMHSGRILSTVSYFLLTPVLSVVACALTYFFCSVVVQKYFSA